MRVISGEAILATSISVIIFLFFIAVLVYERNKNSIDKSLPVIRTPSRVLKLWTEDFKSGANSPRMIYYFARFQVDDKQIDLRIRRKAIYNELYMGLGGRLVYQKKKDESIFIDFIKE